jgi:glycosidase
MKVLPLEIMSRLSKRMTRLYGESMTSQLMERIGLLAGRYASEGLPAQKPKRPLWNERDAVLITYGDMIRSPNEKPLISLRRFLSQHLKGAVQTVHILPFCPYSSDEGFSVIDYRTVDEALGDWPDIKEIGKEFDLMFDLVLNHVSRQSSWFIHFVNGIAPDRDYFIEMDPSVDLSDVVRPRASSLQSPTQTPFGKRCVWTTFSADQIDLKFSNPDVLFEFLDILLWYVSQGVRIIRLDAIAYLWKRLGTSCINLPETHEVVKVLRDVLQMLAPEVILLTETNLPHEQNISYFGQGDEAHMVYQFSLPPLLLHALHTGSTAYLTDWMASWPQLPAGCTFLNFTASHDGIGVRPLEGLIPESELAQLIDAMRERGAHVSSRMNNDTGIESPYELNITYFDALSDPSPSVTEQHIARFLCSQTIMLALKGIPTIYFHSLTATRNNYRGVANTGQTRTINRKRWDEAALGAVLKDPASHTARVFYEYVRRLKLRAQHRAFHPDGAQRLLDLEDGLFGIERIATDGNEKLASISNLTCEPKRLKPGHVLPDWRRRSQGSGSFQDLLTAAEQTLDTLELGPYESVWLTSP